MSTTPLGGHCRYGLGHPPIIVSRGDQRQAPFTERLRLTCTGWVTALAAEPIQIAGMWVAPQALLHLDRRIAKLFMPRRRMSVCPTASHTRTPEGTGITAGSIPQRRRPHRRLADRPINRIDELLPGNWIPLGGDALPSVDA